MSDVDDLGDSALQIRLDMQATLGATENFKRGIQAVTDQPNDHWDLKIRRLIKRLNNQPGQLSKVGDAGKEIHNDNFDPGTLADPAQGLHQPCWIASKLSGSNVAKIKRTAPSLSQFVNELHAETRARGDQAHITLRVQANEVKTTIYLAGDVGVGFCTRLEEFK
jgi:hypothetical protein